MSASLLVAPALPTTLLRLNYNLPPSIVPVVSPGSEASISRYRIADYPGSSGLVEMDISKLGSISPLAAPEIEISGYEAIWRLLANDTQVMDLWAMEELLRKRSAIPAIFLNGVTAFAGTILEGKSGDHFVACMKHNGDHFTWCCHCLRLPFGRNMRFAYLIP